MDHIFSILSFFLEMQNSGLSMTDTVGFESIIVINGMASILSLKLMSKKPQQLTELNLRLSEVMSLVKVSPAANKKLASGVKKTMIGLFIGGWDIDLFLKGKESLEKTNVKNTRFFRELNIGYI